jgi:hypothetical protein
VFFLGGLVLCPMSYISPWSPWLVLLQLLHRCVAMCCSMCVLRLDVGGGLSVELLFLGI